MELELSATVATDVQAEDHLIRATSSQEDSARKYMLDIRSI